VPPLDPIVSATVAIAEAPGSYAFLLGAGVPRDAGVPTGREVFWLTVGALYRLEQETSETPSEDELNGWLAETERSELNYSSLLELLAPTQEERRAYLAQFFEGREPGEAHRRLARLAGAGTTRVFITTNFDRLLEHALREVGIEPIVVTCHGDLSSAPAREHAPCFVLKIHGDYLQQTIRNTAEELAELEPRMTAELNAVFERYGLIVLGYSGSDAAVANALRSRVSRYGLYWVSSSLSEQAQVLVERTGGRHISRPDAATFLAALERRLEVYAAHPSGETPALVNAEVINLLRRGDEVGLRELLKKLRREIDETGRTEILERRGTADEANVTAFARIMEPLIERYLAALLPIIEHRSPFAIDEMSAIALIGSRKHFSSGYTMWIERPQWFAWLIANAGGSFALSVDNLAVPEALFKVSVAGEREPLGEFWPGEAAHSIGVSIMRELDPTRKYILPTFEYATRFISGSEFMAERYPEFAGSTERVREWMNAFNFLATLHAGANDRQILESWGIYGDGATEYSRRIREDAGYRAKVAAALGIPEQRITTEGNELLAKGVARIPGTHVSDAHL
jgi:hypothetical protein